MIMVDPFVATIAVAVISSGVWPVVLPRIIAFRERKNIEANRQTESERDKWFRESRIAYDRVKKDCSTCSRKLDELSTRFYQLLDDLDTIAIQSDSDTIKKSDLRIILRNSRRSQFLKEERDAKTAQAEADHDKEMESDYGTD
jgi:hypothetical protein